MQREITLDDYILTNIDLKTGYFTIRLKDNKEYIVYREGNRDFIEKDDTKVYLSNEVRKIHIQEIQTYQVSGI